MLGVREPLVTATALKGKQETSATDLREAGAVIVQGKRAVQSDQGADLFACPAEVCVFADGYKRRPSLKVLEVLPSSYGPRHHLEFPSVLPELASECERTVGRSEWLGATEPSLCLLEPY